ncbi:MAG: hypothetical protein PHQ92_02390 [Petrimonas sp.]|jgi:hypothetical protein|nr:hypothetical protein [Petrimonas sp.]
MKRGYNLHICLLITLYFLFSVNFIAHAQIKSTIVRDKSVVDHFRFVNNNREESMWSALYGAKSGKIYIGLCTHAEAAHLYEFDPKTEIMRHIVDLTKLHDERGQGINTNGKIHVRMGEDEQGNIYFAGLNEDTGPEAIDPSSYKGAFWYRYNPKLDKVEVLDMISPHFGLLGMVYEPTYNRVYGLAEDGHLYMYDITGDYTRDLGKVDDWDICRTIFADDEGKVYGSFPVAQIWKYDPKKDQVIDLPNIRLKYDMRVPPRTASKPMIDRKVIWRVIEWDPIEKVAYGIMGADNMLFRYDVHRGEEGEIDYIIPLTASQYWKNIDPKKIPFATLALTIDQKERVIYYAPTGNSSFDYIGNSWDVRDEEAFQAKLSGGYFPPVSFLISYDLKNKERKSYGQLITKDGKLVFGLGGACYGAKDGRIYFVGAIEEDNKDFIVGEVQRRWPFSMGLIAFDPNSNEN